MKKQKALGECCGSYILGINEFDGLFIHRIKISFKMRRKEHHLSSAAYAS